MANLLPDCQHIHANISYNCSKPWPACINTKHFDFNTLWNYTSRIYDACASDARLYRAVRGNPPSNNSLALTQEACVAVAGEGWNRYPSSDIWVRLTTWKFPLFQLAFIFPRPPLDGATETFVVFHLLGDPIDTIANLFAKLDVCQHWAEIWQKAGFQEGKDGEKGWRALTLITDAYAEWERADEAHAVLRDAIDRFKGRKTPKANIYQTAEALAADRATKSLPVVAAQVIFIITIGVAIFRTADVANNGSGALNNTLYINVETFSIAFSSLYYWVLPVVTFGSIVGVSQTEAAIPRILERFQNDLNYRRSLKNQISLPNACLHDKERRKFHGGIYTWQPSKYDSQIRSRSPNNLQPASSPQRHNSEPVANEIQSDEIIRSNHPESSRSAGKKSSHLFFAHLIVMSGTITAIIITSLVPPGSFNCRHIAELAILIAWLFSSYLDIAINIGLALNSKPIKILCLSFKTSTLLFWVTFLKDIIFTAATLTGIAMTQWGLMNRCDCYTGWGQVGLALPQMQDVDDVLQDRIQGWYMIITVISLIIHAIIFPLLVCWRYGSALRVYVQRDDKKPNMPYPIRKMGGWANAWFSRKKSANSYAKQRTQNRTNTVSLEHGKTSRDGAEVNVQLQFQGPGARRASSAQAPLLGLLPFGDEDRVF
ncbi:uncharacterized protein KY384_009151 [Bacidia gigantensis]|uniref:uncharacterized protein n=1 Tax=Bacidia gigantensis TaxID=2732470 RepID=UPI001D056E1B|nr:uncharacterized protein KY384_009151 [Bacidia gigantensis]KAG8525507.1 hypothetical protein KY384_009151 [Bacidia gigantensis]